MHRERHQEVAERGRREILLDLIALSAPIADLRRELARFPWDSDALVTLNASDATNALERCVRGDLSLGELQAWADATEAREDIDLDASCWDELRQLQFELSTPELFGPITVDAVRTWLDRIHNCGGST